MIKIILVLIASILVILGIYTYSNQTTQKSSPTPTVSQKKKEVTVAEKVSVLVPEIKKKKSVKPSINVKSTDTQVQHRIEEDDWEEISYLEIESDSELSKQEKDALIADKAYHEVLTNNALAKQFSEEELIEMVNNDAFIKQRK